MRTGSVLSVDLLCGLREREDAFFLCVGSVFNMNYKWSVY